MIAVAILGIIAAIAFPRFNDSIRKGRRADAMSALTAVQLAQERWRGNNASFTNELTNGPTGTPPGLGLSSSTSGGFYTISLANASATGYEVTATAVSGKSQAQDGNCATLRIRVAQGNIFYGSTTAGGSTFDEAAGNRCFSR